MEKMNQYFNRKTCVQTVIIYVRYNSRGVRLSIITRVKHICMKPHTSPGARKKDNDQLPSSGGHVMGS
jgi:hypothetical protein